MKKTIVFAVLFAALITVSVMAQADASVNTQSMNGSTGLYAIPTGHVGWEKGDNFGLDFGYRAVINNYDRATHIPAVTMTLFKLLEISSAYDIQPNYYNEQKNDDLLFGFKVRMPTKKTAIALGGNVQLINIGNGFNNYNAYQPYAAITYTGNIFGMNADTTVVFGKTFYSGGPANNSNVDFGMGFDLSLFPKALKGVLHWIIDFSNFNYSDNSWPNNNDYYHASSVWRGILNTGLRINVSAIPALNKFKLVFDVAFNDLFDAGARAFTLGAVFGFSP